MAGLPPFLDDPCGDRILGAYLYMAPNFLPNAPKGDDGPVERIVPGFRLLLSLVGEEDSLGCLMELRRCGLGLLASTELI